MKYLSSLIIVGFYATVYSQSISHQVIASAGNSVTNGNMNLSYTVGEVAVTTISGNNYILTQGFHQPEHTVSSMLESEKTVIGSFAVYPNPAGGEVYFGYEFPQPGNVSVALYDVSGKLVHPLWEQKEYISGKTIQFFNVEMLADGNYIVSASYQPEQGKLQIFSKQLTITK
jgi:hypothetical protein